jgi:acetyltransferase
MAADACEDYGFALAPFPSTFLEEIEKRFRASVIKLTNPLDLGDLFDLEFYKRIIDRTLGLPDVHGVLFMLTYVAGHEAEKAREVLRYAGESAKRTGKPVVLYVATAQHEIQHLRQELDHPVFTHVEEAVRSLHVVRDYLESSERARAWAPPPAVRPTGTCAAELVEVAARERRDLYLHEATEALACYGIPTARIRHVHGVDEAVAAAQEIGWPVALKLVSRQISHKSDVGGVQLNLRSESGLRQAHDDMMARVRRAFPDADVEGLLVQPMVVGGREMIVGGRRDPSFGPVVLVGLGGIFVDVLREAAIRPAPVAADEARRMIDELRGAAILRGARGTPPGDLDALADCVVRVSQLLADLPRIREVDANPVRVFARGDGCVALDARVLIAPE